MDWTPLIHFALSLVFTVVGYFAGNVWAGVCFGIGGWFFREQAQAEERWIKRFGHGKRSNMPIWGGFDPRVWNIASLLDFLIPSVGSILIVYFFSRYGKNGLLLF